MLVSMNNVIYVLERVVTKQLYILLAADDSLEG